MLGVGIPQAALIRDGPGDRVTSPGARERLAMLGKILVAATFGLVTIVAPAASQGQPAMADRVIE
jgi:hypothetical protein